MNSTAPKWNQDYKTADDNNRKVPELIASLDEDFNNRTLNSDMNFMMNKNSELDISRQIPVLKPRYTRNKFGPSSTSFDRMWVNKPRSNRN